MKPRILLLFAAGALGLATVLPSARAQSINLQNPQWMLDQVDSALQLTGPQKAQIRAVILHAVDALRALPDSDRYPQGAHFIQEMHQQIRALLTPEQQFKYDRTPQRYGGGLSLMTPEDKLARLDALVNLNDVQKHAALNTFEAEFQVLVGLPAADRPQQGAAARQGALAAIRALLTPQQLKIFDATPMSRGGAPGQRRGDGPAN